MRMSIAENIAEVRRRIAAAAARAGRKPESVSFLAVSKTFPAERIREAYAAGQRLFGENRVQEFVEKTAQLADLKDAKFHLIGHLQSNKANKAAEIFHAVDSVDSLKLAERLNAAAEKLGKVLPVLLEINVGGEEQKAGLASDSDELDTLLESAPRLNALRLRGLMSIPPHPDDPEGARSYFRCLRELRDEIAGHEYPSVEMAELSMGMSHDFEVAIEEGSTCVRLGTAIFGDRG